jgi:ribose transport system ATP-binding protein
VNKNGEFLLEIKELHKSYGETRALRGMNLRGRAGTVHTVFGENGSGKSTMVKILSGIIAPDRGEVLLAGVPITRYEPRPVHEMGIVPVLQEVLIAPNRSVLENIFLGYDGLFRRKLPRNQRRTVATAALKRITRSQIDLDALAGALPLAKQQLVVIARAFVHNPRILILDEATATLDIEERDTLFEAINDFISEGRLVIFISHRVDEVLQLSHDVTVLHVGRDVASVSGDQLSAEGLLELVSTATQFEEETHDE